MNIVVTEDIKGWVSGIVDGGKYTFEALVFEEGSQFGINEGKVSKLYITKGQWSGADKCCIVYERGWGKKPKTEDEVSVYESIFMFLEGYRQSDRK